MKFLAMLKSWLSYAAAFLRSYFSIGLLLFIGVVILVALSGTPRQHSLEAAYVTNFRNLGLSPVFPPREEFQTGDVYFIEYDLENLDNLSSVRRTWLGTLDSIQSLSSEYLDSRLIFSVDGQEGNKSTRSGPNTDTNLQSGHGVHFSAPSWESLPIVTFPTVSWNATTGGAFGARGLVEALGIALGRSETAHLDFGDTRAFGLPSGSLAIDGRYEKEFSEKICPRLQLVIGSFGLDPRCEDGAGCDVVIVTRTHLTRSITVRSSNAESARAGLVRAAHETEAKGNISLQMPNITIDTGSETDVEVLKDLIEGISKTVEGSEKDGTPSNSLGIAGSRGSTFSIEREFERPVAIAYDGLGDSILWFQRFLCRMDERTTVPEEIDAAEPEIIKEPELQEDN